MTELEYVPLSGIKLEVKIEDIQSIWYEIEKLKARISNLENKDKP